MKKKLLFVMESLRIGGAEKSLITILSMLDKEKYDIDLYLFRHEGEFFSQLPNHVHLLEKDTETINFQEDFKTAYWKYLMRGDWKRCFHSFCWFVKCFWYKYIVRKKEYYGWKHQKHIYSNIEEPYDVAIGFLEKNATYFTVDLVNAKKKYAFMHTDYDAIPHDEVLDRRYYQKVDRLIVVSEHTGDTMRRYFPFLQGKIRVIKNMVSPDVIRVMSTETADGMELLEDDVTKIVTVGRLTRQKNIDSAVRILRMLRNKGINAEWFVVGEGEERANLERLIEENALTGKFHLVGARSNPYPYMTAADVYVQPSRWEGYGITVAEAKVLCKPIVVSDIPEFREQITDGVNGIICKDMKEFCIGIMRVLSEEKFKNSLIANLSQANFCEQMSELEKLERLL